MILSSLEPFGAVWTFFVRQQLRHDFHSFLIWRNLCVGCYFLFEIEDKYFDGRKLYFIYNLSNFVRLLAALVSILLDNMLVGGIYEFSKI